MSVIYLIHFHTKLHHASHYLGYTRNLSARLAAHREGRGARLMEVITELGIAWECVRTWKGGTRAMERKLKRQKRAPKLCPICTPRNKK